MTPEHEAVLRAVGEVLSERFARFAPGPSHIGLQLPVPQVHNRIDAPVVNVNNEVGVPSITINIDMSPVAAAVDRMAKVLIDNNKLIAMLIQGFAELPAPIVRVPVPEVNVAGTTVEVNVPERPKRTLRIKHGDGTESTITEV